MMARILSLIVALSALVSPGICADQSESRVPRFTKTQLTDEQLIACTAFKAKAGQTRRTECQRILNLGVFPTFRSTKAPKGVNIDYDQPSFTMTRNDVVDLLGTPDGDGSSDDIVFYRLGENGVEVHFIILVFHNGHFVFASTGSAIN